MKQPLQQIIKMADEDIERYGPEPLTPEPEDCDFSRLLKARENPSSARPTLSRTDSENPTYQMEGRFPVENDLQIKKLGDHLPPFEIPPVDHIRYVHPVRTRRSQFGKNPLWEVNIRKGKNYDSYFRADCHSVAEAYYLSAAATTQLRPELALRVGVWDKDWEGMAKAHLLSEKDGHLVVRIWPSFGTIIIDRQPHEVVQQVERAPFFLRRSRHEQVDISPVQLLFEEVDDGKSLKVHWRSLLSIVLPDEKEPVRLKNRATRDYRGTSLHRNRILPSLPKPVLTSEEPEPKPDPLPEPTVQPVPPENPVPREVPPEQEPEQKVESLPGQEVEPESGPRTQRVSIREQLRREKEGEI